MQGPPFVPAVLRVFEDPPIAVFTLGRTSAKLYFAAAINDSLYPREAISRLSAEMMKSFCFSRSRVARRMER